MAEKNKGPETSAGVERPEGAPKTPEGPLEMAEGVMNTAERERLKAEAELELGVDRVANAGGNSDQIQAAREAGEERKRKVHEAEEELKSAIELAMEGKGFRGKIILESPWPLTEAEEEARKESVRKKETDFKKQIPANELEPTGEGRGASHDSAEVQPQELMGEVVRGPWRVEGMEAGAVSGEEAGEGEFRSSGQEVEIEFPESEETETLGHRLSRAARNLAESLYEKTRRRALDVVDHVRIAYDDRLLRWHAISAIKLKTKLKARERNIINLENAIVRHKDQIERARERGANPKTIIRLEKARIKLGQKLETEKKKADRLQSRIEYRNQKKTLYENRRNEICHEVTERIQDALRPYEMKLEELRGHEAQLRFEMENMREERSGFVEELKALEREASLALTAAERLAIKEQIRAIKGELRETDALIRDRAKALGDIEKKIIKADKKAAPYRDKKDEIARLTRRTVDTSALIERRMAVSPSFERKEIESGEREGDEPPPLQKEPQGEGTDRVMPMDKKEAKTKATATSFINAWNAKFGSELLITPEWFQEATGIAPDTKITLEKFIDELPDYHEILLNQRRTKLSKKLLESRMARFARLWVKSK